MFSSGFSANGVKPWDLLGLNDLGIFVSAVKRLLRLVMEAESTVLGAHLGSVHRRADVAPTFVGLFEFHSDLIS